MVRALEDEVTDTVTSQTRCHHPPTPHHSAAANAEAATATRRVGRQAAGLTSLRRVANGSHTRGTLRMSSALSSSAVPEGCGLAIGRTAPSCHPRLQETTPCGRVPARTCSKTRTSLSASTEQTSSLSRAEGCWAPVYTASWKALRTAVRWPTLNTQVESPLGARPYDLRHACVSLWLNAGVPATQVAEWAGHSVHVLMRVYAKCVYGQEEAARRRIEAALEKGTCL
jgi:hypothetical protein